MAVCGACGTENRDKARFCRGCARPLSPVPAAPAGEAQSLAPAFVRPPEHAPSLRAAPLPGAGVPRWLVAGLALAVTVLAAGWLLARSGVPPAAAVPGLERAQEASAPLEPSATSPGPADTATAAHGPEPVKAQPPAPESERPAVAERQAPVQPDRVAQERQRVVRATEPPRPEPVRRQAEPAVPAVPPVAVAPVAVQAPQPTTTVDQSCADSSSFIARDICRVRACRSPAMASDPVCVRYKEMEEASRNRANQ